MIQNCFTSASRGGLLLRISSVTPSQFLYFFFFRGNNATEFGMDVFIEDLNNRINFSPFVSSFSLTSESKRVYHLVDESASSFVDEWLPYGCITRIVVGNTGTDDLWCGRSEASGCRSIKFAITHETTNSNCTLMLADGMHTEFDAEGVNIGSKLVAIVGSTQPGCECVMSPTQIGNSCWLFSVSSGSLGVSSVNVVHGSNSGSGLFRVSEDAGVISLFKVTISSNGSQIFGCSVLHASSGMMKLEHCTVESIRLNNKPLFTLNSPHALAAEDVRFRGISRQKGDGTVIELSVEEDDSLILNNISFSQCCCEEGSGGCLSVCVKHKGTLKIGNFSIVEFSLCRAQREASGMGGRGGCAYVHLESKDVYFELLLVQFSGNNAVEGRDLFVKCIQLNSTITPTSISASLFEENEIQLGDMMGTDIESFSTPVDLHLFVVHMKLRRVCVSNTGYDVIGCGAAEYPCSSFWRGFRNTVEQSADTELIELSILDSATVEDHYDTTALSVDSSDPDTQITLSISPYLHSVISGTGSNSVPESDVEHVMRNVGKFVLKNVEILLPEELKSNVRWILRSVTGTLECHTCTFSSARNVERSFKLIFSSGGTVKLIKCIVAGMEFGSEPLVLQCICNIANCTFQSIATGIVADGGACNARLTGTELIEIRNTTSRRCECSARNGKGGFLQLECNESEASLPFHFENITFDENNASVGTNIYLCAQNLNSSVNDETFSFNYAQFSNNPNMFVGEDSVFKGIDLLLFLVKYVSGDVHVSKKGADLKRCGSLEWPCETLWEGLRHLDRNEVALNLLVESDVEIKCTLDVSGVSIIGSNGRSSTITEEEEEEDEIITSSIIFSNPSMDEDNTLLRNKNKMEMKGINMLVACNFENREKAVVVNEGDCLRIEKCSFGAVGNSTEAVECMFLSMKKGSAVILSIRIWPLHLGRGLFEIQRGSKCSVSGFELSSVVVVSGSVFQMLLENGGGRNANEDGDISALSIVNSTIESLTSLDEKAGFVWCEEGCSGTAVDVNETKMTECKTRGSDRGGSVMVDMGKGGFISVNRSEVGNCECSSESGMGGGVYVRSLEKGELKCVFEKCTFSGNKALVGRDIFVECFDIDEQINESQFRLDFRDSEYYRVNAIFGMDGKHYKTPIDLIELIVVYQNDVILVSAAEGKGGKDERQCGRQKTPCLTVNYGVTHLTNDVVSQLVVDKESIVASVLKLEDIMIVSRSAEQCKVAIDVEGKGAGESCITHKNYVTYVRVDFVIKCGFSESFVCIFKVEGGETMFQDCLFEEGAVYSLIYLECPLIDIHGGSLVMDQSAVVGLCTRCCLFLIHPSLSTNVSIRDWKMHNATSVAQPLLFVEQEAQLAGIATEFSTSVRLEHCSLSDMRHKSTGTSFVSSGDSSSCIHLSNCSYSGMEVEQNEGCMISAADCAEIALDACFIRKCGEENKKEGKINTEEENEICQWNGSLVALTRCQAELIDTTITNSTKGALSISGGNVDITMGMFVNNTPSLPQYPSARRNVVCTGTAVVDVVSLKGGDGWKDNSSLWILNEGCTLKGLASDRPSALFVPELREVQMEVEGTQAKLRFVGELLLPCNLSCQLVRSLRSEQHIERHEFGEDGFVDEHEAWCAILSSEIEPEAEAEEESEEVRVCLLFGNTDSPSSTQSFILKNRSETKAKGDERIVEGGKEGKTSWAMIIAVIFVVLFLIVLIIAVAFIVRWRKQKRRTEELEIIVNDTVKKDPKAFEMVTMEMSPEEQWRRAEREAEKKNEERIKKRVYEKSLGHSESSEHLLSESGSTEYILGKDSDKIPEWALEKEEEEEVRKRSPSPSISSTSTTDSDSTFVRGEDLCPTTSSMSNLVDAMACSSPHEKLIVDLRDSLFMLLHGKNKTKEMAIGTLQEREQTAAQILFWVANGALHSFDEMENPLQSLANLSPHIVLFSEHMVICIVMHSDFLSSDDSDSSSISSSTIVTSVDDDDDSLPSSAFEDDDDIRKECLRWKAPELLMNKKMWATKESVAFSIGMMLWECLTLKIPFGEYEAEVAGQKILNGERPNLHWIANSCFVELVKSCLTQLPADRPSLINTKKEFFQTFPPGVMIVTASDAIDFVEDTNGHYNDSRDATN
ncbi:uncharacterized protein MONOS_2725 [Monocercomonoides exilis]|uniref:uncharacterized protein n=1 Tax=Monocercomonoides exilis TaxID=2049356 RepID=UPI00355A2F6A|nr:hypothetical protein MONOS_2725 [Monocercomonoides exilis]|eukprot:MONOS_2725.1-p1 / transcript=MONOS_2725.1 / gene=MONOS_2725 / organism=Monocercomonoides_exilis_PA203 / gene_product=unspecified product / transcript_product=unspecified product / location=Mono_scaffold00057:145360-151713(+) / protein_length=2117 / sequence_SO=supercontig / SO=protein_coding / is_pseudo=false